jgi:hypothetical protein
VVSFFYFYDMFGAKAKRRCKQLEELEGGAYETFPSSSFPILSPLAADSLCNDFTFVFPFPACCILGSV